MYWKGTDVSFNLGSTRVWGQESQLKTVVVHSGRTCVKVSEPRCPQLPSTRPEEWAQSSTRARTSERERESTNTLFVKRAWTDGGVFTGKVKHLIVTPSEERSPSLLTSDEVSVNGKVRSGDASRPRVSLSLTRRRGQGKTRSTFFHFFFR